MRGKSETCWKRTWFRVPHGFARPAVGRAGVPSSPGVGLLGWEQTMVSRVHYKILGYIPEELAKQIRCSQRGCGKQQGSQYGEDTRTNSHRGMVRKQRSNSFPR